MQSNAHNYLNRTNNRVESINQKLKKVISKFSNIVTFFDDLMVVVSSLRMERDHKAIVVFQKVKINLYGNNQDLMDYAQHLTPYAFGFVTKQYKEMSKISYSGDIYKNTVAISIKSSEGELTVSESTYKCNFHSCMSLPCRHIFFFRKHKNMSSFDQGLVEPRWIKTYYKKNHVIFDDQPCPETVVTVTPRRRRVRVLSGQDKYRRVHLVTQQIARVVSDMSTLQFHHHLSQLENFADILSRGNEYNITEMTDGCGILFNLSFNTLVFAKFKHHESFPNHLNFKD
jgi:zinc finger SWIM domain-containing protein 3